MIRHIPVLTEEIKENLPENAEVFFDGTLGHGGHSESLLKHFSGNLSFRIVGTEKDPAILQKAKDFLEGYEEKINFVNGSYADIKSIREELKIKGFDAILLDLGVNLEHFKKENRGFSLKADGKLDMRYDNTRGKTAEDLINNYSKEKLANLLKKYGDFSEKMASKIAEEITVNRKKMKIDTTQKLRNLLKEKASLNDKKIAVAFQCIRIEVNQELEELEKFLQEFHKCLNKGGRCFVITYHSIEDRLVKNRFKHLSTQEEFKLVNKKVIIPSLKEKQKNKAAESAKLRILEAL